jgi:hypothetical protein
MSATNSALILDDAARAALGRVFAFLLRLADEEAADPDTLEGKPEPAAGTSDTHRCTTEYTQDSVGAQARRQS